MQNMSISPNPEIPNVTTYKDLNIHLTCDLNWLYSITQITNEADYAALFSLNPALRIRPISEVSRIRPKLEYACALLDAHQIANL